MKFLHMFDLYLLTMLYICVVPNCKSVSQLLRFPRDKKVLKKWIASLGNPALKKMRFGQIYKSKRICADHFDSDCFAPNSTPMNKTLKEDVIPSLNLPDNPNKISCRAHLYTYFMLDPQTAKVTSKSFSKLLKEEALNLWSVDRNCVLLFSTMSLKPELKYNHKFDMIMGFQNGNTKTNQIFAEKVIIFMIHGLYTNWKQLISFVFCGEDISKEFLIQSIQDVLATCANLKFRIIATVCEANDCNINAFNELKLMTHDQCSHGPDDLGYESFIFDDREIIILYDASNLLKSIRNDLSHNDIQFTVDNVQYTAQWNDITKYVAENEDKLSFLNLNEVSLRPNKIKKHSRKQCTQIFSYELCSSIRNALKSSAYKKNHPYLEGTSKFLQIFTELFDSLNGNNDKSQISRPLNRTVTVGSKHWEYWTNTLSTLTTVKIIDASGKDYQPICVQKWMSTISGLMHLWRGVLQRSKFKSFSPKYLQLRELENDIYTIWSEEMNRTKQRRCLTPNEFVKSFSKILTTYPDNRLPICDATRPLLLNMFQYMIDKNLSNEDCRNLDLAINSKSRALLTEPDFETFLYEPVLYFEKSEIFAGHLKLSDSFPIQTVHKRVSDKFHSLLADTNCKNCNKIFFNQEEADSCSALQSASNFISAFRMISIYINNLMPKTCNQPNIMTNLIVNINKELDLHFLDCGEHAMNKVFVEMCVRYMIFTWIWKLNRYIFGNDTVLYQNMNTFAKQAILLGRKQKCFKNKQKGTVYAVKNKNRRFTV